MLVTHPVVDAAVPALEQGPLALDPIGVDRATHVLPALVVDKLAAGQVVVAGVLVREELCLGRHALSDERPDGLLRLCPE